MNTDVEAYEALRVIVEDFRRHLESGGNSRSIRPNSPRYYRGGSQPGKVIQYLKDERCVRVERWEPDYAAGGQDPSFIVIPTEYGTTVLEKSREHRRLILSELSGSDANVQRVREMRESGSGKYRVLGVDKFGGSDWVESEHDTADEALREAIRLTRESMPLASGPDIATVFYAYDPQGKYLGGDVWKDE